MSNPQIFAPGNTSQSVISGGDRKGLTVGPIKINWLANPNVATIDLTQVVKTTNFSPRTALIDNSNCFLTVTLSDQNGNTITCGPGKQIFTPVAWFPGNQFTASVLNIVSGVAANSFTPGGNSSTVTTTNITFFDELMPPSLLDAQPLKFSQNAGGFMQFINNEMKISFLLASALSMYAGNAQQILNSIFGSPLSAPYVLKNGVVSAQVTAGQAAASSGLLQIGTYTLDFFPLILPYNYPGGSSIASFMSVPIPDFPVNPNLAGATQFQTEILNQTGQTALTANIFLTANLVLSV